MNTVCGKKIFVPLTPEKTRAIFNHHLMMNNIQMDAQYYKVVHLLQLCGNETVIVNTIRNLLADRYEQLHMPYVKTSERTIHALEQEVAKPKET